MPTLTTMVRACVTIRGGVTCPQSTRTGRGSLLVNQAQYAEIARFLRIKSLPTGSPGTAQGWLHPGGATRMTSASSTIPRMAEADRIEESTSEGCGGCCE